MFWIANVKGIECPNGFANAEAALDFVAENYQSDISRDTDLLRSAYYQINDIEVDGYFAGETWHICRPQMKTNNNVTEPNPLSDLIKTPEEILRDRKDKILSKILETTTKQLENKYVFGTKEIEIDLCQVLNNDLEYSLVADELQEILSSKDWIIFNIDGKSIYLRPIYQEF